MTTHDLLSHFNLAQLPFSKEIAPGHLLVLPSRERALGIHLVGEQVVGMPGRVSDLHEAEDGVTVHVIGIGKPVL